MAADEARMSESTSGRHVAIVVAKEWILRMGGDGVPRGGFRGFKPLPIDSSAHF